MTVADAGVSGPYDYVTLSVDPAVEDKGAAIREWLEENGFDINEFGLDRLVPYLEAGMNMLALRLSKWADAGLIRPVTLDFGEGLPSIPLRATAAAATDDMGILVWVLGEHRAIPANYAHIELNWVRYDWLNGNYRDLVRLASREAGQGFVTEFSGDSPPLGQALWTIREEEAWQGLEGAASWPQGNALEAAMRAAPYQGLREALRMSLTPPPGVTEEEWTAQPEVYAPRYFGEATIPGFDFDAFFALMEERVVDPIRETAALFEATRKTTRFFTVMAPEQMTVDPIFDFDPTRTDVSRFHSATQEMRCETPVRGLWRMEVPGGLFVHWAGVSWPFVQDPNMPASRWIFRFGPDGARDVRVDNRELIAERLEMLTASRRAAWQRISDQDNMTGSDGGPMDAGDDGGQDGGSMPDAGPEAPGDGGCSTAGGRSTWWLLLGVALFLRRRNK